MGIVSLIIGSVTVLLQRETIPNNDIINFIEFLSRGVIKNTSSIFFRLAKKFLGGQDVREPAGQAGFPRSKDFRRLPHFLDGTAVKKDSEGGVHPREGFGCVVLFCTVQTFRFAFG